MPVPLLREPRRMWVSLSWISALPCWLMILSFIWPGVMGTCPLRGKILGVLVERYRGIPPSRDAGRTLARDTSSVENTGGREYPLAEMLRGPRARGSGGGGVVGGGGGARGGVGRGGGGVCVFS